MPETPRNYEVGKSLPDGTTMNMWVWPSNRGRNWYEEPISPEEAPAAQLRAILDNLVVHTGYKPGVADQDNIVFKCALIREPDGTEWIGLDLITGIVP